MKEHKLAAIVFTDIVGYTKRMGVDEAGTMQLLARQRDLVFPLVREYGGEVIKELGDGLLIMFTSANKAVRFAMAVQDKLIGDELTIRAGIHIGDVIFEGGDVFGSAVNIAARIEPLAPPGGICISEDVRSQLLNQVDIVTASEGRKTLKGVNQPMEIFRVVTESTGSGRVNFFRDMWRRRVMQITAIYLVLAYLLRLLMGLVVNEFMLSPHLVNLVWFLLIAMIPSMILIAYFHGRGVTRWTRWELIGLPVNLFGALLLIFFMFKGKDMGAITTTLTMQNEDGEAVERLVLKNEFRKNILLFNFKNNSGDTALDYLQYGMADMMQQDLNQDLFMNSSTTRTFLSKIREAGYENTVGLPVTLMKRFADQRHYNHFVAGELKKEGQELIMDARVYDTELTKLIKEIQVRGKDPFVLVDDITPEIKRAVGLAESQIASATDLPIAEMYTGSEKALYYYSRAIDAESRNNWNENSRLLEMAIKEDPAFTMAQLKMALALLNLGNLEKARANLSGALQYLHKLPDRQQFVAKYVYYVLEMQPDKALAVLKMWIDLYPDDIVGRETLAERYAAKNMFHEAIGEYRKILELDPERYEMLQLLGAYYLKTGMNDSSLFYYQWYADALPKQSQSYRNLGVYYRTLGDMEKARESYEKALLVADMSELVPIKVDLANISRHMGDFDKALQQFTGALADARTAADSATVYDGMQKFYLVRGQADKALEYYEMKLAKYMRFIPPRQQLVFQLFTVDIYATAGEESLAYEKLEAIAGELESPLDNLAPFGYMLIYAETGQADKIKDAMKGAEELIQDFGEEQLMNNIYYARARVNELTGKYVEAIEDYKRYLENNANEYNIHTNIARCYRHLKEFIKAQEEIMINLKYRPFDPVPNYEAAMLFIEKGETGDALQYLERAVKIWEDADADYAPAKEAKATLEALKGV